MIPQSKINYPDGTIVKTEVGTFYLKGGLRFSLPTQRIVNSWSAAHIPITTEFAVSDFKKAGALGFRDGSYIRSVSGDFYIVSGNKRRKIANPDWFDIMQLQEREFVKVSDQELTYNKEGEPLA